MTPSEIAQLADTLSRRLEGFTIHRLRPGLRSAVHLRILEALDQDMDQERHQHHQEHLPLPRVCAPPTPSGSGSLDDLAAVLSATLWGRLRDCARNPSTTARILSLLQEHRHQIELDLLAFLSAGLRLGEEEEEEEGEGDPDQDQDQDQDTEEEEQDQGPTEAELLASLYLAASPDAPLHLACPGVDKPPRRTCRSREEHRRRARAVGRAIRTRTVLLFPRKGGRR